MQYAYKVETIPSLNGQLVKDKITIGLIQHFEAFNGNPDYRDNP